MLRQYTALLTQNWINISISLSCLTLCCSPAFVPHTEPYQPHSEWELKEYKKANLFIFPDDVRNDLNIFKDTVIAWPGIIQTYNFIKFEDRVDVELILEHHYYDWIEDFSIQKERIFLSPHGEGLFYTIWPLRKNVNLEEWSKTINNGDLTIVYGYPDTIFLDSTIMIKSTYIRSFPRNFYSTKILDYGRVYDSVEKKYLKPRTKHGIGEICCMGALGVGLFAGMASFSFLGFGDEILGGYWACGALVIGGGMFSHDPVAPGPALAIPLALGFGALSYYDFAYGDKRSDTEVFFVNALGPVGITVAAVLSASIFPSHAFKMSEKLNLQAQQNGILISMIF